MSPLSSDAPGVDAYCSSGPSPTGQAARPVPRVHLLGVGAVARAYLSFGRPDVLIGASDSSGTALDPAGLDEEVLLREKAAGRSVIDVAEFASTWPGDHEPSAGASIVLDVTPSDPARGSLDAARVRRWLARGQSVALASKHAIAADPTLLSQPRVGANAVLGGTGRQLQAELPELRSGFTSLALAGNASTTTIISTIERGGTLADGLARAEGAGVLEPDPELDLRGTDAAVKLALVVGALTGRAHDPGEVDVPDLRAVPLERLRDTARRGATTRLVGRADRGGRLSLRYEVVPVDDALAVGPGGVAYRYELGDEVRVHRGAGVGARGTAEALIVDVDRLWGLA